MKFSFFCTSCGAKLQLDETYRGQTVLCPGCNEEVVAPEAPVGDPAGVPGSPDSEGSFYQRSLSTAYDQANPFATPENRGGYNNTVNDFGMVPIRVTVGELLGTTVSLLKRYPKEFIYCGAVFALLTAFVGAVMMVLLPASVFTPGNQEETARAFASVAVPFIGLILFVSLASLVLSVMFFHYIINLLRTGDSSTNHFVPKSRWAYLGTFLGTSLFFLMAWGIFILVGICLALVWGGGATLLQQFQGNSSPLLIVGGVLVGLLITAVVVYKVMMLLFLNAFYVPFIIDKNVGVLEAFAYSRKFSKGNFGSFVLVFIIFQLFANLFRIPFVILGIMMMGGFSPEAMMGGGAFNFTQLMSNTAFTFVATPLLTALAVTFYFLTTNQPTIFRGQLSRFYDS